MLLKQLRYLVALSQERHFGNAAQLCHVSQPAFSGVIRSLEQHLGLTIVQRGQRFHGFTPEGEKILKWAHRMLADCENMYQEIHSDKNEQVGAVRIGAIPTTISLISLFINACIQQHPRITYKIYSLSTTEILKRLEDFELDIGITYLDENLSKPFEGISLFSEDYVFITRDEKKFSGRKTLSWADATSAPLCLLTADMHARRSLDEIFRNESLDITPVVETNSIFLLYAHVRCTDLCSIVPRSVLCLQEMRHELTAIPIEPLLQREVGLILLRERQRTPVMRTVIDHVVESDMRDRLHMIKDSESAKVLS